MLEVLIAGDGLAAVAAYKALSGAGLSPKIHSGDGELLRLAQADHAQAFSSLSSFIEEYPRGIVMLAGYKPIVGPEVFAKVRTVNVHASLLPKYRGMHAVVWALLNAEERIGITLHEVDRWVDHGPILWQEDVASEGKTSWQIMIELHGLLSRDIAQVLVEYQNGRLVPKPQDHAQATFCGRRRPEDCQINWNWSSAYVERFLRALVKPYPLPYFLFKDKQWVIERAEVVDRSYHEVPGHVVYRDGSSVWVKLSDGLLRIFEVSHEGQVYSAPEVVRKVYHRL